MRHFEKVMELFVNTESPALRHTMHIAMAVIDRARDK
jgi:hypothetical protein